MEDVGLPNSISLLQALKQCAMEAALIERAAPVPAMPIPKQEPAVPVPDNKHDSESPKNIGNEIHNIATALAYSGSESIADELGSIAVRLWALDPSPRITEQDAREIIEDYIGYCDGKLLKPQSSVVMGMYIKNEFTDLLNKLNANAVAEPSASPKPE